MIGYVLEMRNKILEFSFLPQGVNEVPKNVVDIQYIEQNFKLFFKRFIAHNFFHIPPGLWRKLNLRFLEDHNYF